MPREQNITGKIIDERCICGHLKSIHAGHQKHGRCVFNGCECKQYTWKEFVFGTKNKSIEGFLPKVDTRPSESCLS